MALVGGGGAPNVVGSNPAGTGGGLNYVGDRCYAYGGQFAAVTGSLTTYFNFTTGAESIDGVLQLNSGLRILTAEVKQMFMQVEFNSEVIANLTAGPETDDAPFFATTRLIIPPFTKVKCSIASDVNQAATFGTATFVGKIIG